MTKTPVLFFVYNRMETTRRVFEEIAKARPETLLIVADGPHPDRPDDQKRCQEVRDLVSHPSWPCNLRVDFAATNLGFKKRISSGLTWAFAQFEEVIILEDDCLPDPAFFPFCDEMLARYRDDDRIMMVTGSNFQFGRTRGDASYYFSHGVGTWGWASWRRALQHFDPDIKFWPTLKNEGMLEQIWPAADICRYWLDRIEETERGDVDAWDFQWAFSMWRRQGLQVAPNVNMITYIGCLPDTAHTSVLSAPYCNIPRQSIAFPLVHPAEVQRDTPADLFEFYRAFMWLDEEECDRRSLA